MILFKSPAVQLSQKIGNSEHEQDAVGQNGVFSANVFREDDQYFQISDIEEEQGQKTDMVDCPKNPQNGILPGKKSGSVSQKSAGSATVPEDT